MKLFLVLIALACDAILFRVFQKFWNWLIDYNPTFTIERFWLDFVVFVVIEVGLALLLRWWADE